MKKLNVRTLTGMAVFTAIVVVLQVLGTFIRFGPFAISLVLVPIVVGAALYGPWAGAWLGFVFGVVVLFTDSAAFLAVNVPATIFICLLKGLLAGLCAGLVYRLAEKVSITFGVAAAAMTAPVVNTGVFLIGCLLFFLPTVSGWGEALGFPSVGNYILFGLVGGNFLFELLANIILSPVIVRLINIGRKERERA